MNLQFRKEVFTVLQKFIENQSFLNTNVWINMYLEERKMSFAHCNNRWYNGKYSGKQVKDLCEPVAVRHMKAIVLTRSHIRGHVIGEI